LLQTINAVTSRVLSGTDIYLVRNQKALNGASTTVMPWSVGVTSAVLKLKAGDYVYLRLFAGGGFSNNHHYTFFLGSLLDPV
jgi:hypothetical protein